MLGTWRADFCLPIRGAFHKFGRSCNASPPCNYYAAIPDELIEASKIDGAGILGIYGHILFPLSLPGFVVVMIWQFTSIWNDFLFAVIVTSSPSLQPITVALNNIAGSYSAEWNVQMAGALIAALPTLLVYIFLSRYFMSGLLAGSVKG